MKKILGVLGTVLYTTCIVQAGILNTTTWNGDDQTLDVDKNVASKQWKVDIEPIMENVSFQYLTTKDSEEIHYGIKRPPLGWLSIRDSLEINYTTEYENDQISGMNLPSIAEANEQALVISGMMAVFAITRRFVV